MKKLATLIATSILGISSVAAAKPAIDFSASASLQVNYRAPVIRDHRDNYTPQRIWMPPPVRRPAMTMTKLGTVATGKQTLLAPANARFDSLVLSIDGAVELKQVAVFFTNGQQQMARFDRVYTSRMAPPLIDLAGDDRLVKRVVVYTTNERDGEITLYGRNLHVAKPDPFTRWAKLGAVATGKQVLKPAEHGRFDRLALTASGRVHVKQVLIRFADGSEQLAKLDVIVTASSRAPIIELAGNDRRIKSLIVYTADDQRGELTLYAI